LIDLIRQNQAKPINVISFWLSDRKSKRKLFWLGYCGELFFYFGPSFWRRQFRETGPGLTMLMDAFMVYLPQEAYWKAWGRLRHQDQQRNHKRIHRLYMAIGLNIR
jgi:hypothetical protein